MIATLTDTASSVDWEIARERILSAMEVVMGPLPVLRNRETINVRIMDQIDCGSYVRRYIEYNSEPDNATPAYLLIPKKALVEGVEASGILALHSTNFELGHKIVVGLSELEGRDYGHELALRGHVVIAPPYPLMADYQPDIDELGYASGTMKAIWDNIRALDVLDSLTYVRKGEYGAIGHSLGGHNALFTAAFESRIKAVVTSCGFDSFADYMQGNIFGWTQQRYMPRIADYKKAADIPFDFADVLSAIAPRPVFVNAPLRDSNFQWQSVDRIVAEVDPIFEALGAPGQLKVVHPDCEHDFPADIREQAYGIFTELI